VVHEAQVYFEATKNPEAHENDPVITNDEEEQVAAFDEQA
jgi:hypothetical protein